MRNRVIVISLALLVLAPFLYGGCGDTDTVLECFQEFDYWNKSSDLNTTTLTPPASDITGNYDMTGFDVDFYEDSVYIETISEADVPGWSGTMTIQSSTTSQTITLPGYSSIIVSDSYTVSYASTTEGTFHLTGYDVDFTISGNSLTTDSGLVCESVPASAACLERLSIGEDPPSIGRITGGLVLD